MENSELENKLVPIKWVSNEELSEMYPDKTDEDDGAEKSIMINSVAFWEI
jgi:hypothetical protein